METIFRKVATKTRLPDFDKIRGGVLFLKDNGEPHIVLSWHNTDEGYLKMTYGYWLEEMILEPVEKQYG